MGSYNTANIHWIQKGSRTTLGPVAYLLRLQALHQRQHHYVPMHDYVPGEENEIVDICSRTWQLTNSQLLNLFNRHFLQPLSWEIFDLSSTMNSALISVLFRKWSSKVFNLRQPKPRTRTGSPGMPTSKSLELIPFFETSPSCKSLPPATTMDALHTTASRSRLTQYQMSSAWWARRSNGWGPLTPNFRRQFPVRSIFASNNKSGGGTRTTRHHNRYVQRQ